MRLELFSHVSDHQNKFYKKKNHHLPKTNLQGWHLPKEFLSMPGDKLFSGVGTFVIPKKGQPNPKIISVSHAYYHHMWQNTVMNFKAANVSSTGKIILPFLNHLPLSSYRCFCHCSFGAGTVISRWPPVHSSRCGLGDSLDLSISQWVVQGYPRCQPPKK